MHEVKMNHFCWDWIKKISNNGDYRASALILLAEKLGDSPHPCCGFQKIKDWLYEIGAQDGYVLILMGLQLKYYNSKIFKMNAI